MRVRRFHPTDDGADISISDISITYDSLLFHRRDLNLGPVRYPDGSEATGCLGQAYPVRHQPALG